MGSCLSSECSSTVSYHPAATVLGHKGRRLRTPSSRLSSLDYDSKIQRIPGRMFLNGSSDFASLFTQRGKKGPNQDAMLVWENFCSRTDTVFCGVFDGHGPFGHIVSKKVRDSLPLKLNTRWQLHVTPTTVGETSTSHDMFRKFKEPFLQAFKATDRELRMYPNIDCFCSGTTAVTLIKQGEDVVIGNVGDSRAVLGTRDEDDCIRSIQLTVDLKPNLPGEAERIRRCKGRVLALREEPEVTRVWLPDNNGPGLAMARAFGDFCLKEFGVISVPDVFYRRVTEKDEFIVLATDGVWDVLSNEEVVGIVASTSVRSMAAQRVVDSAVKSWKLKYPKSRVDDCTVICLFLTSASRGGRIVSTPSVFL